MPAGCWFETIELSAFWVVGFAELVNRTSFKRAIAGVAESLEEIAGGFAQGFGDEARECGADLFAEVGWSGRAHVGDFGRLYLK